MKKRIIALSLSLIMAVSLFAACTSKTEDNDAGKMVEKKTFTVGFDKDFPPYGYEKDGEYVGFDLDLAAEVCARNNWELVKQPIDWDSKDMELNSGAIDCIWNGFTINGRENDYTWTVPYVDNSQIFVVKAGSDIKTLADLKGKTVLVQAKSSALDALKDDDHKELLASLGNLDEVPEYNTAFLNLEAGSGDAIAMDIGVAKYQLESRGSDKFVILDEPLSKEQYGIGFKKGNEVLRDTVQKTLVEMAAAGKLAEIAKKWGLTDAVCLTK